MVRTRTPSGAPTPMPILTEVLRPPGRGVGDVVCIVEEKDVEKAGREEAGGEEEVDLGGKVDTDKTGPNTLG